MSFIEVWLQKQTLHNILPLTPLKICY